MINELLEWLEYIEDVRQERKVKHKLKDIIVIVLFATLANVDDWVEMEYFAHYYSGSVVKTKILDFYNELIWLINNRVQGENSGLLPKLHI